MLNRFFSVVVIWCAAASIAAFGQGTSGQEFLFQFNTPPNTFTQAAGYVDTANLASPTFNIQGPSGIAAILPTPDGTKFYLVGTAGPTSLWSADSNFDASSFQTITGLGASCAAGASTSCGAPTAAAISPDGKYLLVAADQLYVITTANNQVAAALPLNGTATFEAGTPGPAVCISCWITTTPDSQYAYVLTTLSGGSVITKVNLATLQQVTTLSLRGTGTSLSISPTGQLYETVEFGIYEIDPVAFTAASGCSNGTTICLNFQPGSMHYTPDGSTAYLINLSSGSGGGVMAQVNLQTQAVTYWNPTGPPQFTDILVASSSRIFAYSASLGSLYDVSTSPLSATVAAPSLVTSTSGILDKVVRNEIVTAAISNEIPSAAYLFLLVANGAQPDLYNVNLDTNTLLCGNCLSAFNGGVMETAYQPATTGAAAINTLTNNLTITANGGTSTALIGQVLSTAGLPVFAQNATFSTDSTTGLVINTPAPTTNAQGVVETTVSVPTAGATCPSNVCTITLTAGGASTNFTVNVPAPSSTSGGGSGGSGSGGSGSGGSGTVSQMTVISGDGQFLSVADGSAEEPEPLIVQVTSTTGAALPNVQVTFSLPSGALGSLTSLPADANATIVSGGIQTLTNSSGQAGVYFRPTAVTAGFQQTTVTASSSYGSVNYTETVYYWQPGVNSPPTVEIITPATGGAPITVTAGQTSIAGIQALIIWNGGGCPNGGSTCPVPGVGIQLYSPDNLTGDPTQPPPSPIKCQGSTDSNAQGIASCNVAPAVCPAGGATESSSVLIWVGNAINSYVYPVTILPGGANALNIISGNNQTANAGAVVSNALVVQVLDACGNALAGQQVTFKVTAGSATVSPASVITAPSGDASTTVTLGQTAGAVVVTATLTSTGATAKFSLTSVAVATSFVLASGGGQQATVGQPFASPLLFRMTDKSGNPVPGATVNFTVSSGSATVSPTSAMTNSAGQVQTTVTAGSTAGPITITAAGAGLTASASLTSVPPGPTLTASSFMNAASFTPGLVPCGLAVVQGSGLAPTAGYLATGPSFGPLPYSLGTISSMTVGGIETPISSVSNENGIQQATFQTPCELPTTSSTTNVSITVNSVTTQVSGVPVLAAQPGIFTYAGPNNYAYAAVVGASDGLYVTPSHPAVRGQTYYLVVTGLGQTAPAASTDNPGGGQAANQYVIVGVNNVGVPVLASTYASGLIGAYLVEFTIPANNPGISAGTNVPISVGTLPLVNGQPSTTATPVYSNLAYLPVVQ